MNSDKNKNKPTFWVGILIAVVIGAISYWGENSEHHAMSLAQAVEQGVSH
jgi:CHASE3 domain sensor protein